MLNEVALKEAKRKAAEREQKKAEVRKRLEEAGKKGNFLFLACLNDYFCRFREKEEGILDT